MPQGKKEKEKYNIAEENKPKVPKEFLRVIKNREITPVIFGVIFFFFKTQA